MHMTMELLKVLDNNGSLVAPRRVNFFFQTPTTNNAQAFSTTNPHKMSAEHDPFYLRYGMILS